MEERWKGHLDKSKTNKSSYFHNAIIKYGVDNWAHEVIEVIEGEISDAELAEKKWIAFYKSNIKEFGYNLTSGGNANSNLSSEVKQKISETVKKQMLDLKRRRRQSVFMKEWHKNNINPFKGKKHSEESKNKMSEKVKEYFKTHDNPFLGKTHSEESKRKIGESSKQRCADPNWKAPLQINPPSEETKNKMRLAKLGKHTGKYSKELIIELCKELKSIKKVAKKLNCTSSNICYLIKSYKIKDIVDQFIDKPIDKENLLLAARQSKSKLEMSKILNCSETNIYILIKKFNLKEEVEQIIKNNLLDMNSNI